MIPTYRHPLMVRITHWLNLVFMLAMLGSGLQIFNAHPALYWGDRSDVEKAWLAMDTIIDPVTTEPTGITQLFGHAFHTTGLFGFSGGSDRGFPRWATIPSEQWLAMGRRWHFFFAWLLVINALTYIAYSAASGHLARNLVPRPNDLRHFGRTIGAHLHLQQLRAESDRGYNTLQQIAYLAVIFLLGPLMVLTGLTLSPRMDAALPWLPELFTGRQSARSIHFLVAFGLLLFTLVHVTMVILVNPLRQMRAMITGWLSPPKEPL